MTPKPWYHKGLQFSCQGSGKCCANHGDYSYVYLTDAEVEGLAAHLAVSEQDFRARWCLIEDGWTVLKMDQPACPFLTDERKCGVYEVRPKQCSSWPFWSDNLDSEEVWKRVAEFCPGAGGGRSYSRAEIDRIAAENDANVDV